MNNYNLQCPKCQHKVVWKFFYPKTRADYCCQHCGHCWKQPLEEILSRQGWFLGDWDSKEIREFESNIVSLHPDIDWSFFKGKKIYTAWQAATPQRLITTRTLNELTYWVAIATQDTDGTWYETYRRLADKSFAVMGSAHS
jgi:hypothetical protein